MLALLAYVGLFAPLGIAVVGVSFVSAMSRLFPQNGAVVAHERKIA